MENTPNSLSMKPQYPPPTQKTLGRNSKVNYNVGAGLNSWLYQPICPNYTHSTNSTTHSIQHPTSTKAPTISEHKPLGLDVQTTALMLNWDIIPKHPWNSDCVTSVPPEEAAMNTMPSSASSSLTSRSTELSK